MAMRHDEAFKFLFDLPAVCADLLRAAAPGLWPQLDPNSVRNLRVGDSVAADLTRRTGDALCQVDLQAAKLPDGRSAYLVVPLEFQSGDDQGMAERMGEYVSRQLDTLRRQGSIPADDTPPVLPVVVYDGAARWSAPDGLEPLRPLPPDAAAYLAAFQPPAYLLVDLVRARLDDWPWDNRLRAVARLLRQDAPERLAAVLAEELARFAGAAELPFRQALYAWAGELWTKLSEGGTLPPFDAVEGRETPDMTSMIEARFNEWKAELVGRVRAEGMVEGRAEGMVEGRAEGVAAGVERQRTLLCRQAERKFGAETAAELARRLVGVADPDALALVGERIIDCDTGAGLLESVDEPG